MLLEPAPHEGVSKAFRLRSPGGTTSESLSSAPSNWAATDPAVSSFTFTVVGTAPQAI